MALEQPKFPLDKLKAKLKKKYPNHNFDVPSMPDTKCKVNGRCPGNRAIYYDNSGNYFCGAIIKMMDERTMEKSDKEFFYAKNMYLDLDGKYKEISN